MYKPKSMERIIKVDNIDILQELEEFFYDYIDQYGEEEWESPLLKTTYGDACLLCAWRFNRDDQGNLIAEEIDNRIVARKYIPKYDQSNLFPIFICKLAPPTNNYTVDEVLGEMFQYGFNKPYWGKLDALT